MLPQSKSEIFPAPTLLRSNLPRLARCNTQSHGPGGCVHLNPWLAVHCNVSRRLLGRLVFVRWPLPGRLHESWQKQRPRQRSRRPASGGAFPRFIRPNPSHPMTLPFPLPNPVHFSIFPIETYNQPHSRSTTALQFPLNARFFLPRATPRLPQPPLQTRYSTAQDGPRPAPVVLERSMRSVR